jgi:hypothetical protein
MTTQPTKPATCAACGRTIPPEHQEHEWRHVGGQADRREVYCGRNYGHQRELTPPSAA